MAVSLPLPLPVGLAHYTTLDGLSGIVQTGKLWASNVSFLNDNREVQHGLEASLAAIPMLSVEAKYKVWRKSLQRAAKDLEEGKLPDTYAVCFCQEGDLLSQWRGYGGAEQGVSVIFDRKKLELMLKKNGAEPYRVIYCDVSAQHKMRTALRAELKRAESEELFADILGNSTQQDHDDFAYETICKLLPKFKHLGFKDEREYRFVIQTEGRPKNLCFRAKGNVMVPYLELGPGRRGKLPITKVIIGPGKNQELTGHSLRFFLKAHDYNEVTVTISKVPFRS